MSTGEDATAGAELDPVAVVRNRSKQLLGSAYRAEVAGAIGELEGSWTRTDLEGELLEVPRSCVNKELTTLLNLGFVKRLSLKDAGGHFQYETQDVPEYWGAMAVLARPLTPSPRHPTFRRVPKPRPPAPEGDVTEVA